MAGATDVERLAVLIEGNTKAFENAMKRVERLTDTTSGRMEKRFDQARKRLDQTFGNLGATLSRGLGALGVGLSARELIRYADAFTAIQNALKVTGLEGDKLNAVYGRLYESAQRNAVPLGSLAALYGRVSLVSGELGVSQDRLVDFSDRVALAIRVSGQSAESASGALTQLSQALGGGVVRAEEFNSIMEGAPTIAQAAARGIQEAGGSVAKLRQLVVDGKVSSKAFFDAIMLGTADLEKSAATMSGTVAQAMVRVNNAFTNAVGEIDKVTGSSASAAKALDELANGLKWVADNVEKIKGPYSEIAKAIRGAGEEAHWAAQYISRLNALTPAGVATNVGAYVGRKIASFDRRSPALSPVSLGGEMEGDNPVPTYGARPAPGIPTPRSRPSQTLSINDPNYRTPAKAKDSNAVGVDSFARSIANAEKRIALQNAETAAINQGTAAVERARLVAELETAAKAANAAEGLKNTDVTAKQREQINGLADAMYRSAEAAQAANGPLAKYARDAADVGIQLQEAGVSGLRSLEDALVGVAMGTKTASEAFREMANAIIADLIRIAIRAAITGPIAGAFGFGGGAGGIFGGLFGGGRASGGPVMSGTSYRVGENGPEIFTPRVSGRVDPMPKGGGGAAAVYQDNRAYTIDARGATPDAVAILNRKIDALRSETPQMALAAVAHANRNRPSITRPR